MGTTRAGAWKRALGCVAASCCLGAGPAWAAPKTDVVVLVNGDRITGEVKELSYGQLKFKTDHMGTIYIEWDEIHSLTTKQVLQVEMLDGSRRFGAAPEAAAADSSLLLAPPGKDGGGQPVVVAMADVARISTLEQGAFFQRLDGSVSFGYSYTKATDIMQSNFAGDIGSRNVKRKWDIALDWSSSNESGVDSSQRATLTGTIERFLKNRYYYEGQLIFSQNDELGLDLRSLVSGTVGRYLVQRQDREWRAGAGLAVSREQRADGTTVNSVELPLTTSLRLFRLDSPKTDVEIELTVLPSLTESGRVRGEAAVNARHEIIHDLFFEMSLYESYDNRPSEGSEVNDWNVVTSLGYSF